MNRAQALAIVHEFVKNENLIRHMLAVEAAMRLHPEVRDRLLLLPGLEFVFACEHRQDVPDTTPTATGTD